MISVMGYGIQGQGQSDFLKDDDVTMKELTYFVPLKTEKFCQQL
ncbi:ketol-acid reductoisomerase [Polaromonas sp. CG_9.5]|nr:ketol-acid reductoisomerase [Polaromonas sp. CG_9.5]